jgi:GMP synthase (glutamine-hydrolysing)
MTNTKELESTLNIWAFQHVGHEDLGSFEQVFLEMGADIRYICGRRESLKDLDPTKPDILIVLGGPMGLYQTDEYPYLIDELELVKSRIEQALGANVYKGPKGQEIGFHQIDVNHAGEKTPLRHLDQSHTKMMQWHGDTFDIPEHVDVKILAHSDLYHHQAYSYKENVLAVQCHPEITEKKLEIWINKSRADLDHVPDMTVDKILEDVAKFGPQLKQQAKLFLLEWLGQVVPNKMMMINNHQNLHRQTHKQKEHDHA